jgi:hypothetical protein
MEWMRRYGGRLAAAVSPVLALVSALEPRGFRRHARLRAQADALAQRNAQLRDSPQPDHGPGTALHSAAVSTHAGRLLVLSPSPSLAEATRPTWSAARKPGLFFLGRFIAKKHTYWQANGQITRTIKTA